MCAGEGRSEAYGLSFVFGGRNFAKLSIALGGLRFEKMFEVNVREGRLLGLQCEVDCLYRIGLRIRAEGQHGRA